MVFVFFVSAVPAAKANTNSFPVHLVGTYMSRSFASEYYSFGADGRYTNVVWLCSRGNSRDFGIAALSGKTIALTPEDPRDKEEPLVPVKWGDRQYLIRVDEMTNFCSAINMGAEPRDSEMGDFLMRRDDWKLPVTGQPELPPEYGKYFLTKAAKGKITEVIDNQSAWINLGTDHGLMAGMKLIGSGGFYVVEQAYGRQARVKLLHSQRKPAVGHVVSTAYTDKAEKWDKK
ncbi:MAG: hypothetical protein ACXW3Z_06440 [Limisphaerales bacterium]